jgi:prolyl-tRNA synthetase
MVWPREIAPYDVHVVVLGWDNPDLVETGEQIAFALDAEGLDVLLDDRPLRPGEKFADADLIGCPLRVTVGKKTLEDGAVDLKDRLNGDESRVASLDLAKRVVAR